MPDLLEKLLTTRGITDPNDVREFLNPDYERHLHDPFLLDGMHEAVDRIIRAIRDGEKIKILSDFDADGIPASVVLRDAFKKLGVENFSTCIPHRNTEGFGLNERLVDESIDEGVKLLITLDCGMGDATRITRAREAGIDVIVIDHHHEGADGAPDCIVVNPNKAGDEYPNKHLCGAGVTYKVVQALIAQLRAENDPRVADIPTGWEKWLLDMVGIATLSDMVALVGENRALAHYGLMVLRKSPRPGIRALCQRTRLKQSTMTEDDVVFTITPRINAASRMDEPEAAFKLLSAETPQEGDRWAEHLESVNAARKGAVAAMAKEIKHMLADREIPPVIVVGSTHWRPGLLGLAATNVAETYNRPVFVWGQGEAAMIKGSCRSGGNLDVMALMTEAREHFVEFGGHKYSGGFSTTVQHLLKLEETLSSVAVRSEVVIEEEAAHDAELDLSDVTYDAYNDIRKLAPFGVGNDKPVFLFKRCYVAGAEAFGKERQHMKLQLGEQFRPIQAVQFFADDKIRSIEGGQTIDVLAHVEEDAFGKRRGVRLRIVDALV